MTSEIQGVIADWLHARGIVDADGFGKRAAVAIGAVEDWNEGAIREILSHTKSDLFRRNSSVRKKEVCDDLGRVLYVKCRPVEMNPDPDVLRGSVKIMFFAANPLALTQLDLAEEVRNITEKLRAAKYRDTVDLISAWASRPDDLLQYLNEHEAAIIHFSGHGSGAPGLVMQDNSGQPIFVSAEALQALFRTLKGRIRLVVLNACDSLVQAKAIAKEIDCVIGMRTSIGDEAARVFAASLYRAIAFGKSVAESFEQGKVALILQGIQEEDTPVLVCKPGINASSIRLVSR
jgi:hypothetical protein